MVTGEREVTVIITGHFCSKLLFTVKGSVLMSGRARNYVFTVSYGDGNVTELLPEEFPEWLTFATWQLECGAEGTMHYQGYLECSGVRSMAQLHAVPGFERAWFAGETFFFNSALTF